MKGESRVGVKEMGLLELHPSREEVERLVPALNEGEWRTMAWLEALLSEDEQDWHLYVQPKVLNRQPDFVVAADGHGVFVVEVKDWDPDLYRPDPGPRGLQVRDPEQEWARIPDDPLAQAYRYRQLISDLLSPPGDDHFRVIKAMVVFPRFRKHSAVRLLDTTTRLDRKDSQQVSVVGADDLERGVDLPRKYLRKGDLPIGAQVFSRFRARLDEPDAIARARRPLQLSSGANNIATNPNNAVLRRVRGPAGSGKTLGVAARAANLAGQGKRVLVLTFNITLAHYVQDAIRRHARANNTPHRNVDTIHFHGFCMTILDGGGDPQWMVRTTIQAYLDDHARALPRYDAILVDEGQDFEQDWWNFLRQHVRRDTERGEMLLVIDTSQGLYQRRGWGDETSMPGCGFPAGWTRLQGSYRLPADLIPVVRDYAATFLELEDELLPDQPEGRMFAALAPTRRRWVDATGISEEELVTLTADAVDQMLEDDPSLHPGDVVVLAGHDLGEQAMGELTRRGHANEHIFADTHEEQRRRKRRFWAGTPQLKGSTVHSYKGWEARGVVLLLTEEDREQHDAPVGAQLWVGPEVLGYVALTRVAARHDHGPSHITVITNVPQLAGYGSRFERELTSDEQDQITRQLELGENASA